MQVPPDHNRHMAMLKAALPYAMPESRRAIEIIAAGRCIDPYRQRAKR